ncbi:MAG: tetratricopeptide repeat protein [Bacteroidales bacterium]|nr:tetratricopeptide repeat protein [Bacteroidales bacterium]MDD4684852.1 tetratricopeptide repeat protein [Bacteroidales bacterium]
MMGNIFAKYEDDIDTAMTYYNQVLIVKPNDNIALNNIGANLLRLGKTKEAKRYLEKAIKINSNYPNSFYALALVAESQRNFQEAFQSSLDSIKRNKNKDELYYNSFRLAVESAQKLFNKIDGEMMVNSFIAKLELECGIDIRIETSDIITTAAKIEYAENYKRNYHLVKYNPKYPAKEHLIMHELMHLELVLEARKAGVNQLFITNPSFKSNFLYSLKKFSTTLRKKGLSDKNIDDYLEALFDGMNRQMYNSAIDLFIEDRLYNTYPTLRPFQFLSLLTIIQEGIEANTNSDVVKNSPSQILSKSKILNLINAFHFKELYHIDLILDYKPTKSEMSQAEEFYNEFVEYRSDKKPGEEYELVQHWSEDLGLDSYFEIVPEEVHRRKTIDQVITEIENDPYSLDSIDSSKEIRMKMFLDEHSDKDLNSAVVMYMVSAMTYIEKISSDKTKLLAFEFAKLGMSGISPSKDGYIVPSIEGETFSGYKALAYYYVSFAIAFPEMLSKLQLPFDKEYEVAKELYNL